MPAVTARFDLADWNRLPEGFSAQLLEGVLLEEPAPTWGHQNLVVGLVARLVGLVGQGRVSVAPTDVVLDAHNVVQPDVVVLRAAPPRDARSVGVPLGAFEVLSPRTRRRDRAVKADKLLAAGTAEVWPIDDERGTIDVRTHGGIRRHRETDVARSRAIPGFRLSLGGLRRGAR